MSRKTRKLMWSVPLIAAVAVIGALAAFMTLGTGSLFANELPDNPQNLKVKAASGNTGRTALVLTWEAPASGAPDMYRIDVSKDNRKYTRLAEVPGNMLTHSHVVRPRGMDRMAATGWERFYRVYAMNSHGYGAVSSAESATTKALSVPGEVTQVKGSSNDPTIVNLTWTAPDDGGSDIWGYCILALGPGDTRAAGSAVTNANCLDRFRSEGPGKDDATDAESDGEVIRILPGTSYTHKSLRAANEWTYEVYAFNRYGNSDTTCCEVNVETDEADEPTAPGNLIALQAADGEVQLYWTAPKDGGQNVVSYRVEVSDTKNSWPSSAFTDADDLSGTKDSTQAFTADSTQDGPMFAAINVPVATQTEAAAYQVQHTVTAVDTYYYQVRTITGEGTSEKMSPFTSTSIKVVDSDSVANGIQFTPPIAAPGVAADGSANIQDTNDDDNETESGEDDLRPGVIKLTVTEPTAGANSYRVDISSNSGRTWSSVHSFTLPIDGKEYEHEGLDPEKGLHFRLFAKKGSDLGLGSIPVQDYAGNTDMPGPVQDLVATADGAGKINVSWQAPESDGGADIEQYCIVVNELDDEDDPVNNTPLTRASIETRSDQTDPANCTRLGEPEVMPISISGDQGVFEVDAGTTMVTFSGLEQESRWQFEVFALNDASDSDVNNDGSDDANGLHGVSASSNKAKATTDAADEPGAPQRLTAQFARDTNEIGGIGTQGVLLLWNPPSNPAGAPVKAYMIERKVNDGEFIVRVSSHNAATTHWVDRSEPAADETREYRITAINDVGTGTAMATVMIPYPAAGHSHVTPVLTAPDDVAVSDTGNPVTVTWTPGENADGGHLVLVFNSDFTEVPGIVVPMEEGTYTFNDMDFDDGDYVAVVVSIMTRDNYLYDYATFTVQ